MPLARIDLLEVKSAHYRRTVADVVYEQMIAYLDVASADQKDVFST